MRVRDGGELERKVAPLLCGEGAAQVGLARHHWRVLAVQTRLAGWLARSANSCSPLPWVARDGRPRGRDRSRATEKGKHFLIQSKIVKWGKHHVNTRKRFGILADQQTRRRVVFQVKILSHLRYPEPIPHFGARASLTGRTPRLHTVRPCWRGHESNTRDSFARRPG